MDLNNLAKLYDQGNSQVKLQKGGFITDLVRSLFSTDDETETNTTVLPTNIPIVPVSNQGEETPTQQISPDTPKTPVSMANLNRPRVMVVFVGLPKCGKTKLSVQLLQKLKSDNIRARFVETPVGKADLFDVNGKYINNIKDVSKQPVDVIICNGNNYLKRIRDDIKFIANLAKPKLSILYVDFSHSEDLPGEFTRYKDFCTDKILARTDAISVNTNLTKAIGEYETLTQSELESGNYIKIHINNYIKANIESLTKQIKNILKI